MHKVELHDHVNLIQLCYIKNSKQLWHIYIAYLIYFLIQNMLQLIFILFILFILQLKTVLSLYVIAHY